MTPTTDCGRRLEDLSDYLEGITSDDQEHITHCPQCQAQLAGLRSLHGAAADLLEAELAQDQATESGWLDSMLSTLQLETRAGRSLPLAGGVGDELSQTEGSVIALVRAVGDSFGNVLIGKCLLEGSAELVGAPVSLNINVSARYGEPLPALAESLRTAVLTAVRTHSELNLTAVNVAIVDLLPPLRYDIPGDFA